MRRVAKSCLSIVILLASGMALHAQQSPANIIAAQVREQGYECKTPDSVAADIEASTSEDKVWILTCEKAKYRVKMVPDMAADIEQID